MACDKKWAIFAVFVSFIVVIAIVVPIAVFRNTGQSNGELVDGGSLAPSDLFVHFGLMIKCTTKKNPLRYHGYGCHCGLFNGGEGRPVLDSVDQCCKDHDVCLERLETSGLCTKLAFMYPYTVDMKGCGKKQSANITCKASASYNDIERTLVFGKTQCAEAKCQCDRDAAICFSKNQVQSRYKLGKIRPSTCKAKPGAGPKTLPPTTATLPAVQTTMQPPVRETVKPAPIYRIA
ncbi:phospholipase A2-like [Lytechinus pictus]|uniref:phospholipase A2-like n=1 Tax=Lytechinus pictus TaxID=7653 RepID=UPI0030BA07E3